MNKPWITTQIGQVNIVCGEFLTVFLFRERNNFETAIQLHLSVEEPKLGQAEPRVHLYVEQREKVFDVLEALAKESPS